ncbi:MAG: hypothetical protein SF187_12455 [Deltaproteobacteria bacterium]|nr:hypothetical protein [Deltaproteobacteria bacterium]
MTPRHIAPAILLTFLTAGAGAVGGRTANAEPAAPACKAYNGKCCDPAIAAHLPKEAVFSSCGKSDAQYLGEQAAKDTCKYFFKIANEKEDTTFVQVYAPKQKDPGTEPTDPFFDWTRVGKAYVTKKAKTPKAAPMLQNMTGIWYPGKDYVVNINASVKVCSKAQALKLAAKVK